MLGVLIALVVTVVVAHLILKNYKAQTVLFAGGIVLMALSIILGTGGQILPAKQSTGFVWFDIFKFMEESLAVVLQV